MLPIVPNPIAVGGPGGKPHIGIGGGPALIGTVPFARPSAASADRCRDGS